MQFNFLSTFLLQVYRHIWSD